MSSMWANWGYALLPDQRFVIPLTLEAGNSLKKFWLSRVFRLYPLYWFSLALGVAWMAVGHFTFTPGFTDHLVRNALVNLTMIQGLFKVPSCQELYYTLAIEMALYAGISLLFLSRWPNGRTTSFAWRWCSSQS